MSPDPAIAGRFDELLETCREFLLSVAAIELSPNIRTKGGASDLVQETLAAAHAARDQFRGQTLAEFRAWLRVILLNELGMFRRRYSGPTRDSAREVPITPTTHLQSSTPVPLATLIDNEQHQALETAISSLPEDIRHVVALRIDHGLTFAAIGERTGRTEEATRKLFDRSLASLRAAVGRAGS